MKFCIFLNMLLIALISCSLATFAEAQDKETKTDNSPAVELLQNIERHIKAGEWSEVANLMTDKAWNKWCESLVVECISIANMDNDMGFGLPGMDDAQENIQQALKKHQLDEIKINQPTIEIRMHASDDEDADDEEPGDEESAEAAEEQLKNILAALDANDKRNDIVQDLWQARSGSPFSVSVFGGKVEKEETGDDTVSLTITPAVVAADSDEPGVMIQIVVPPVVVDVRKIDDDWKFVGTNEEKSAKAMKNFKPKMMGGGKDFSDF